MKEKELTKVYMREVLEKEIKIRYSESLNAYVTYKHIISTSSRCHNYINGRKIVIADNGYTILEYSPLDENYNVRMFINRENKIIKYYFDIILKMKYENEEIFYDDLYLDVIYDTIVANGCCNYITLADEVDLIAALNNKEINQEQFNFAYSIALKLMEELSENQNKFVNRGLIDLEWIRG